MPNSLTTVLSFIFFFSGFSSLMYQVAWQRLLTLYYGVGAISMTLIVSVYMLGLGLGALLGGELAERVPDKIRSYFLIELGIGVFGLISFPFLMFLGKATAGSPFWLAGVYQFLFLCIPTVLMGMTLPVLTKIFNRLIADFFRTVSFLYFINTLGAAAGAIFAGYVVISFWGLDAAIYIAAVINGGLALLIWLARSIPVASAGDAAGSLDAASQSPGGSRNCIYIWVLLTGFLAIGYEIIWFRVIGVLVKASPYAFCSILFVYLAGIALGSFAMGRWLARRPQVSRRDLFFALQVAIGVTAAGIVIAYYFLTLATPFSRLSAISFSQDVHPPVQLLFFQNNFQSFRGFATFLFYLADVFFWPLLFVLIPTVLMGASFPVISDLALARRGAEGMTIGKVYFLNIVGNVLGGLGTGFVLLPVLGTEWTLFVFSAVGLLFGWGISRWEGKEIPRSQKRLAIGIALAVLFMLFPKKGALYEVMHSSPGFGFQSYFEEGVDGVVMTYVRGEEVANFINGHSHGGRPGHQFYLETVEAAGLAQSLRHVLVIGYGTGSIVEALLKMPDVERVTLVELNRTLIKNLKKIPVFQQLLSDPRIELIYDDGRRYLERSPEKFDAVFMSPLRTTTAYSNNLYSRQFFELIAAHLGPPGLLVNWTDEYPVMAKTIASAFKYERLYVNGSQGFFISSNLPFEANNPERVNALLSSFSPQDIMAILQQHANHSLLTEEMLAELARPYPRNEDWRPAGEYYVGLEFLKAGLQR